METTRKSRQRNKAKGPPVFGLSDEDSQTLYALVSPKQCESAGVTDEKLQNRHEVRYFEACLDDFDTMAPLRVFQNLQNLTLCALALRKIEGLEGLQELEELWLSENQIQRLEGLDGCVKLRKLYLSNNRISRIEGLQAAIRLEVLWINENQIETLEGLEPAAGLKELWIAKNRIATIGRMLDPLQKLVDLNLSGNLIGNFKEVLNLNRLPALRKLRFSDPHFGENPICSLCNYNTYVLYHLNFLAQLDSLLVSEEAQSSTESTFMKKRMYYNMRIKTIQRASTNLLNLAAGYKMRKIGKIYEKCTEVNRAMTLAEQEIYRLEKTGSEVPWPYTYDLDSRQLTRESIPQLEDILTDGRSTISRYLLDVSSSESSFSVLDHKIMEATDYNIQRLLTELDTGGNIRYEEGKIEDNWFNSCQDLMMSRFQPAPYLKIYGLKVTRVTRIHNRFLRNRFEEKLEKTVDISDPAHKRKMEYLFFGYDSRVPKEQQRVTEEGFRTPEEYRAMGLPGCIPLCNNVLLAELGLIKGLLSSGGDLRTKLTDELHCIVICKVYLGQSGQDESHPTFQPGASLSEIWSSAPLDSSSDDPPKVIFRACDTDPKLKVWLMLDNALVLPEYLVEFEYQTAMVDPPLQLDDPDFTSELDRGELRHLARALAGFKAESMAESKAREENANLPSRSRVSAMTIDVVRGAAGTFNLSTIKYLNLAGNEIAKIDNLDAFVSLEKLVLSFNRITRMEGVAGEGLKWLDLSGNLIGRIGNMEGLQGLEKCYLGDNALDRLDDVGNFLACPHLTDVQLYGNPIAAVGDFRIKVIRSVAGLMLLDGSKVSEEEKNALTIRNSNITREMIKDHCMSPQELSARNTLAARTRGSALNFEIGWEKKVETLILDRQHLISLHGLEILPNLRRVSFNSNEITSMQGLEQCRKLEELSLEANYIGRIEGLQSLVYLKKLDLGSNRIQRIEGLIGLDCLTQLSLEDNQISSLQGLESLKSIMELYIANNQLRSLKEIQILKEQPKLIILDVSGNPMCSDSGFRPFALFHLRKLKVLDGGNVDPSEQVAARDQYAGRLTEEIMDSRLGGYSSMEIRRLDLSDCKLRDFDNVFNESQFPLLQELKLNNNHLSTLKCFGPMPKLVRLYCSYNRLVTLTTEEKCGLRALPSLEELDVSNNELQDFCGLQDCTLRDLKLLRATNNNIAKIEYINHLRSLRELDLRANKVRQFDLYCFNNLHSIRILRLDENGIRSISNLGSLEKLQKLFLSGNRLTDLFELDRLYDFERLEELVLTGNPITRKNMYRLSVIKRLPTLRVLDDKDVTQEERERVEIAQEVKQQPPLVHLAQMPTTKVPVKLTSVNFDGVFSGMKPPDPLISQPAPPIVKRPASSTNNALVGLLGVSAISTAKPLTKPFKPKK